jgi:hypothetical protein
MQCPPEVADILVQIITTGLLRIRTFGWNADAARCAVEADHLHNLPGVLRDFRPELLSYYWHADRVAFLERSTQDEVAIFEPLWQALAEYVGSSKLVSAGS